MMKKKTTQTIELDDDAKNESEGELKGRNKTSG